MRRGGSGTARKYCLLALAGAAVLGWTARTIWRHHSVSDSFAALDSFDDGGREWAADAVTTRSDPARAAEELRRLDEALRTNRDDPVLLAAKVHLELDYAPAAAAAECQRILARSPKNYFALEHAAVAFLMMTNLTQAMHYAARALQARDTSEGHVIAGNVFFAKRDFKNALNHYRAALAKEPGNPAAQALVRTGESALASNH